MDTMDTDTAIIEETRVILAKNKDTWILVGLDKQLIHIMEKDGPTALAMESNHYWLEMLTKTHMKMRTQLPTRKLLIKQPMKLLTKWLTRLPMLLHKKQLIKLPMLNKNMSTSMNKLITELTMLNSTMISQ